MCGITALIGGQPRDEKHRQELRKLVLSMSAAIRHRGPDWSGVSVQKIGNFVNWLAHERLAIVDPVGGAQPILVDGGNIAVTVNGEIFNHTKIREQLKQPHEFKSLSDCEVIPHMYADGMDAMTLCSTLDGYFAFVLSDAITGTVIAARDPLGIMPLYWGYREADGAVFFSSEFKAIHDIVDEFWLFPPGQFTIFQTGQGKRAVLEGMCRYYNPVWWDEAYLPSTPLDLGVLRRSLEDAVRKKLMADVPFGVLLSGGLDSSLIAALTVREMKKRRELGQDPRASHRITTEKIHSFTIGLAPPKGTDYKESPDIVAAREVATYIGTEHHEFFFTYQEGLDGLSDAIRAMETYDVTTIRAGTPMFFLARRIKAMGIKMILSGEGADEVFGGYLYFHKAPNKDEFHRETVRKVKALHYYDVLRANKSTAASGVEVRVPFLDKEFLDVAMALDPEAKLIGKDTQFIEKYIVRKAFDDPQDPVLPPNVLWRQKEQFSDGVGYGWIDVLKDYAEKHVSDEDMKGVAAEFAFNTPTTKEALLYRRMFASHFPGRHAALTLPDNLSSTVACSSAVAIKWDESFQKSMDPSGRSVHAVHHDAATGEPEVKRVKLVSGGNSVQ